MPVGRPMMRRGPGLVGTAARTAVVVGTAGAGANRQANRREQKQAQAAQQQQAQQPQQAPAQPAPAAPADQNDVIAQLEKLADLKANGLLTDEEYASAKAKLLG